MLHCLWQCWGWGGGRGDVVNIRHRNLQKVWLVHVLNHHSTVLKTSWSIKWQRGMYKTRPCFLKRPFTDQRGRIYRAQNLQKVWLVPILNLSSIFLKTSWSIDPLNDGELGTQLTYACQRGHSHSQAKGGWGGGVKSVGHKISESVAGALCLPL